MPLVEGRAANAAIYPPQLCQAICRGFVNQKAWDRSEMVNTGKMSAHGLSSFIMEVCEMNRMNGAKVEKLLSTTTKDGSARPKGDYPNHWMDYWHEEDGGHDDRGV